MAEHPDLTRPEFPRPLALAVDLVAGREPSGDALSPAEWEQFCRLVISRHRVAALVQEAAMAGGTVLPPDVADAVRAEARETAANALRQKAESHRLLTALSVAGCRPAILKGWALGEALYGSAALRHAKDIDIHVPPGEIDPCLDVLAQLGYMLDDDHAARGPFLASEGFRAEFNDLAFWNPDRGIEVELHWRSQHFHGWPEPGTLPAAWEERALDGTGMTVRVPGPAANLIYLALHGQQHLWQRLKWLADIARLFATRDEAALLADLEQARAVGAARAVIIAGHLANQVLGAPLPRAWPEPGWIEASAIRFFRRAIAGEDPAPGTMRTRAAYYGSALALAETLPQRLGVLRYGIWRRLRFPGVV